MRSFATAMGRRKPRSQPWRRRHWRSLIIFMLFVTLVSGWFVWRLEKRMAWTAAQERARDLGVVQTREEFEARFGPFQEFRNDEIPMRPDSPYQAVLKVTRLPKREIMGELPSFSDRHPSIALKQVPYPDESLAAMTDYAMSNREALAALHKATQSGKDPELASKQRDVLIELLAIDMCVRAHHGDAGGVFQNVEVGLILLRKGDRKVGPEAACIEYSSLADELLVALGSALARTKLSDAQLTMIQSHLRSGDIEAAREERDIAWQSYTLLERSAFVQGDKLVQAFQILLGSMDTFQTNSLNAWSVRRELPGHTLAEQEAIIAKYSEEEWAEELRIWGPELTFQIVDVALDGLRYYQATGALPESLDALIPSYRDSIPHDFWSGAPLRYVVDETGFVVYSVGRGSVDDGGDPKEDIIYRIQLPPAEELASSL